MANLKLIELSTGETDIKLEKKSHSMLFFNFLNREHTQTTLFTTTSICHQHIVKISDKWHK